MDDEEAKTQTELDRGGPGALPPTRVGADMFPSNAFVCCYCGRLVDQASRVLPHMNAYLCSDCKRDRKGEAATEAEIANRSMAPWTAEQVISLNDYQRSSVFLPFICLAGHSLMAESSGYICAQCPEFVLYWTYPWVLDGSWKTEL